MDSTYGPRPRAHKAGSPIFRGRWNTECPGPGRAPGRRALISENFGDGLGGPGCV